MNKKVMIWVALLLMLSGCSSMTVSEKDQKRAELDAMAAKTVAGLIEEDPAIETKITNSLGYGVANMKLTKVPAVGVGGGEGVFLDQKTQRRVYFNVKRLDFGGGWGARSYKILLIAESEAFYERLKGGTWEFQAGAELSAGTASAEGAAAPASSGFSVHVLSDGGASATVTARVIRIEVDTTLTEPVD